MTLKHFFMAILLMVSSWSGYYLYYEYAQNNQQIAPDQQVPVFTGRDISNNNYDESGVRNYQIDAKALERFAKTGETNFTTPHLFVFKDGALKEWEIISDIGVLNKKHELNLSGNVIVKNLLPGAAFDTMTTDSITIELSTKDFSTEDVVNLVGPTFETTGVGMKGNFTSQQTTLLKNVQGIYEAFTR
ncbi:LPS export ABC transporter periplasmic protein LptC [Aliivibrio finisterrensis]|uniref:LPS export ABC transporter periplasmic protein LptC n=1 Tax=Aliivibrio finisterrensis TaxID=511998 RepID=UPI00102108D6|nr:LPS export ABC transporter periplasmic protein LptC [Aliivibrio finisterrensis]RYU69134.1 LPS export ABC transporter periplasmic protein LptC [Aliivibrio finisterrensis]RYU72553.1 LPS export ABC transporter periplasmic protein LptC [Aliivibrio finisterrensis]RYU75981.1 LPS export ABC transporter periplasmic protein LptC [Aliivibrio finisterrensis]